MTSKITEARIPPPADWPVHSARYVSMQHLASTVALTRVMSSQGIAPFYGAPDPPIRHLEASAAIFGSLVSGLVSTGATDRLLVDVFSKEQKPRGSSVVVALYGEKQKEKLRVRIRELEASEELAKAFEERELVRSLMEDDWLGARILASVVQHQERTGSEICVDLKAKMDTVAVGLARLTRFKALHARGSLFTSTRLGETVYERFDSIATN